MATIVIHINLCQRRTHCIVISRSLFLSTLYRDGVSTSKSTIIVAQLGDNPAYVGMTATVTDDDKKILHAEANVQESMTSE